MTPLPFMMQEQARYYLYLALYYKRGSIVLNFDSTNKVGEEGRERDRQTE